MKRLLLALLLFLQSGLLVSAQDLIVLKDATEIQSKVIIISAKSVTYREWDNLSGPTHTINRDDILLVKFANGKEKLFPPAMYFARRSGSLTTLPDSYEELPDSYEELPDVYIPEDPTRRTKTTFQGYLSAALGTNSKQSLVGFDCSVGARVHDYFYVGPELGYGIYKYKKADKSTYKSYFEYGANLRGYLPLGNNLYPFLSLSLGRVVPEASVLSKAFCRISAGLDYGGFSAGIGWTRVCDSSYFSIQVAWRFGK